MVFSSVAKLEKVVTNLNRLKWERFNNVVIPNYEYEINDHILIVEMDYVRGTYPRSIHHYNIIYDEFVERESDFSCTDLNPMNFIVNNDRVHLIARMGDALWYLCSNHKTLQRKNANGC